MQKSPARSRRAHRSAPTRLSTGGGSVQHKNTGPRRSDAQRNRERILKVALDELSDAADFPLSSIAKKAGVSQGTFYRNFPSREALALEIYRHEAQQLADTALQLLDTRPPDQALREWMEWLTHYVITKAGLADAMRQAAGKADNLAQPGYAPVVKAIQALVAANHAAGTRGSILVRSRIQLSLVPRGTQPAGDLV
ncbi:TetR/AcrR family transcriptional regulator [Streptomyces sp. WAC04770]|nr:TetR/AcrR family transcriptional regulator [Streptomyces sp. WAC04770]